MMKQCDRLTDLHTDTAFYSFIGCHLVAICVRLRDCFHQVNVNVALGIKLELSLLSGKLISLVAVCFSRLLAAYVVVVE